MGFDSGRGFTSAGGSSGGQGEIGGTLPVGTEGQVLYFDGTTNLWTATSNVYNDDTNNRVGIGITSSLLAKLHVKSASGVTLQVDTSTISNNFTILDTGGLVGIGKTPSSYKLDIEANDFGLRVTDNQGFGNLLRVNKSAIDLFDNQGNQIFTVYNINGSSNIKGSSITLCQDSFFIALGTQFGGEIQHRALSTNHLALVTDTSSKDIIFGIGGANEKLRVKNTEIISQIPIAIAATRDASAILQADSTTKGFLPPRMTSTQASAITKVDGLMLYVTDTNGTFTSIGFWGVENNVWVKL